MRCRRCEQASIVILDVVDGSYREAVIARVCTSAFDVGIGQGHIRSPLDFQISLSIPFYTILEDAGYLSHCSSHSFHVRSLLAFEIPLPT